VGVVLGAPRRDVLGAVALSANWMWPCRNEGEDARLYQAVEALSDFAIALGINVPTGKDSLSMKQQYPEGEVLSPGTVIVSAAGHCDAIEKVVEPVLQRDGGDILYIDLSGDGHKLGGSSFAQILNGIGDEAPSVLDAAYVKVVFNSLQRLIKAGKILAGHDVASGGLVTTLLELCFADNDLGAELGLGPIGETDTIKLLFAENCAVVIQAKDASVAEALTADGVAYAVLGKAVASNTLKIKNNGVEIGLNIASLRDTWFKTSYLLDNRQTANGL